MSLIKTKLAERIATIAFDHDAKRNAFGADLIVEVLAALDRFRSEKARAVVLRSASSGKVWSAGHDVDELPRRASIRCPTAIHSSNFCGA
jgi:methylmalonyl-CoA decarboxylase